MSLPWEKRVFVIAEAGVNHNGNVRLAKQLIDAAADARADAVKFQTWKAGEIVGKFSYKVDYLQKSTGAQESMEELAARLCLPYSAFRELQAYAQQRGILFLSTPDGFESLNFLIDELKLPYIKVGSTEVTHVQFLEAVARKGRPVILSTGLSNLEEVRKAVEVLQRSGSTSVVLLHCTSEYPAPDAEMNVRAVVTLRNTFRLPAGLSDHSVGKESAIAAVALGAVVIEKHFTLDKSLPGPDHAASLTPDQLTDFVRSIRAAETVLGDGVKRMTPSEQRNVSGIRRSIVAARPIPSGARLTRELLICKRPGSGLAPELMDQVIGMRVTKDLEEDEPLQWDHLARN